MGEIEHHPHTERLLGSGVPPHTTLHEAQGRDEPGMEAGAVTNVLLPSARTRRWCS